VVGAHVVPKLDLTGISRMAIRAGHFQNSVGAEL
jgi:hypothetical protein